MDLQHFGWMYIFYLLTVLHFGSAILFPEDAGLPETISSVLLSNERQTLNDCPLRYYKHGISWLASSAAATKYYNKDFAHIVKIGWTENGDDTHTVSWNCSGVLLSVNYVLTSAECVTSASNKPDSIQFADKNISKIQNIIVHPKKADNVNNIALIELSEAINITELVLPSCLWNENEIDFESLERITFERDLNNLTLSQTNYTKLNCDEKEQESNFCLLNDGIGMNSNEDVYVQKQLMGNAKLVPFLVGFKSHDSDGNTTAFTKMSSNIEWIESIVGLSMDPIKCGVRHINERMFEDVVTLGDNKKENGDFLTLVLGKAHISTAYGRLKHKVSVGWTQDKGKINWNCSGSFFHENYILTSAKCVQLDDKAPDSVKLGEFVSYYPEADEKLVTYAIKDIIIHPEYRNNSYYNDIALIRVEGEIGIQSNAKPACLWTNHSTPLQEYEYYGFGPESLGKIWNTEDSSEEQKLLSIQNNYITEDRCNNYFHNLTGLEKGITEDMMCMKNDLNIIPKSCKIAKGASLNRDVWTYKKYFPFIFAVESFGKDCGFGYPAVSIRVSHYIDWIEGIIFNKTENKEDVVHEEDDDDDRVYFDKNDTKKIGDTCFMDDNNQNSTCQTLHACKKHHGKSASKFKLCVFDREPIVCCPGVASDVVSRDETTTHTGSQCSSYQELRIKNDEQYTNWSGMNSQMFNFYEKRLPQLREFPHAALIGIPDDNKTEWLCAGALISTKHILTSANCVGKLSAGGVIVRLGNTNTSLPVALDETTQEFNITKIISHPGYSGSTSDNDVAVLVLEGNAKINEYVSPACVWNNETHTPFLLFTMGISNKTSDCLEVDPRMPMYNSDCKKLHPSQKPGELCADAIKLDADTCQDKPGDILQAVYLENDVFNPYIVGIYSRSLNCTQKTPSIFTRISSYKNWLDSVLK